MTTKQTYYMLVGLVIVLSVGLVGVAYQGQVMLKAKSKELVNSKAKLDALDQQETALKQAKKDIAGATDLYNIAKVVVPESKNQTQTVRQIVKLAQENNITLQSIDFPTSSLGSGAKAPGATTSSTPTTGGTATSGSSANLSQLKPVASIPGVYDLELTVTSSTKQLATYPQLISFLSALEKNRLTAQVSTIDITPDPTIKSQLSFSLKLDAYIKP